MKEPMLIWITLPGTTTWHKTNDFNHIALILLTHPDAEILVTVDDLEKDPREVWQVPEARYNILRFFEELIKTIGADTIKGRLTEDTHTTIAACLHADANEKPQSNAVH